MLVMILLGMFSQVLALAFVWEYSRGHNPRSHTRGTLLGALVIGLNGLCAIAVTFELPYKDTVALATFSALLILLAYAKREDRLETVRA